MTVATPHLGVRQFTFVPTGPAVVANVLAPVLAGRTGTELFLNDGGGDTPLVVAMATEPRFTEPLRAFRVRQAYGCLQGDFLVPFGTALFNTTGGVGVLDGGRTGELGERDREGVVWQVHTTSTPLPQPPSGPPSQAATLEHMTACLDALGWTKVGVRFRASLGPALWNGKLPVLPLAHNMICALGRRDGPAGLAFGYWQRGRAVMDHAAEFLISTLREEEPPSP